MRKLGVTVTRKLCQAIAKLRGRNFPFDFVDRAQLSSCMEANRRALQGVQDWMPEGLLHQSVFRYGINPEVEPLINLPLDNKVTHADLLTCFGRTSRGPCRYLELGVSVGKTLWQVLNTCGPCECWGFDIEEINPALKAHLTQISREEWPTPANSLKKTASSMSRFIHEKSGGTVVYLCADIFDEQAWGHLANGCFNLVLSDALHTPEALSFEWEQITKLGVLDSNETVIMWDDLDGSMRDWFVQMRPQIAHQLGIDERAVDTALVNGWLGEREFPHRLGVAVRGRSPRATQR